MESVHLREFLYSFIKPYQSKILKKPMNYMTYWLLLTLPTTSWELVLLEMETIKKQIHAGLK